MDITNLLIDWTVQADAAVPMYVQLANNLTTKIQDFTLLSGTRLPPERELAEKLGISRTTIVNAYRLLEERGLVYSKIGSGTYVQDLAAKQPETEPIPWELLFKPQLQSPLKSLIRQLVATPVSGDMISFATGMPDPKLYPLELFRKVLENGAAVLQPDDLGYIATEGYLPLRREIALWQKEYGIEVQEQQVLVVSGAQQGLYLMVRSFIEPRDFVIVESPTYLGAIQLFEAAGARILCLPQGKKLDFAALEDYLIRYRPKLFYTIPTFQNPTGRVMTLAERKELLRLAARYRLVIIEDDPYGRLSFGEEPPLSLKALDSYGGVVYIGTFSKILFPGLRMGWVAASPQVVNRLAQEKQYVDLHSSALAQKIIQHYLRDGGLKQHLQFVRREYRNRRDAMATAIRRYCGRLVQFEVPSGGFYLWCKIDPSIPLAELVQQANRAGVSFVPGNAFYVNDTLEHHECRLCYAAHREEKIQEGIRRLGGVLRSCAGLANSSPTVTGPPLI